MKFLFVLALLMFGLPAMALDVVASNGQVKVTLSDTPCVNADVLGLFQQDRPGITNAQLHSATYSDSDGSATKGCWTALPESVSPTPMIYLRYADGDAGMIPAAAFKPVEAQ